MSFSHLLRYKFSCPTRCISRQPIKGSFRYHIKLIYMRSVRISILLRSKARNHRNLTQTGFPFPHASLLVFFCRVTRRDFCRDTRRGSWSNSDLNLSESVSGPRTLAAGRACANGLSVTNHARRATPQWPCLLAAKSKHKVRCKHAMHALGVQPKLAPPMFHLQSGGEKRQEAGLRPSVSDLVSSAH